MTHNHGSEYQVRIVQIDGAEELSEWLESAEQVAETIAADRKMQGTVYWVRARIVLCADCPDKEQRMVECPVTGVLSARCSPHDSAYLMEVGSKSRCEVEAAPWYKRRRA